MTDIEQYRKLAQPPKWALKTIGGGRLKGMTDIKPAWRIQAMTEVYGLCGTGWKYEVVNQRTEPGSEGQVFAFVDVLLYIRVNEDWSDPIPGAGGSVLIEKERGGLHSNDEAFKMAATDALSSAMKMIGMAADVYAGQWDGSKYRQDAAPLPKLSENDTKVIVNATKGIAAAKTTDDLMAIGEGIKEHSPAIQNALRNLWANKHSELKKKEETNANSGSNKTTAKS